MIKHQKLFNCETTKLYSWTTCDVLGKHLLKTTKLWKNLKQHELCKITAQCQVACWEVHYKFILRMSRVFTPENINDWILDGFCPIIFFYCVCISCHSVKVQFGKESHDRLPTESIWLDVMHLFSHFELDNKYYEDVRISDHNPYELHTPLHLRRNTLHLDNLNLKEYDLMWHVISGSELLNKYWSWIILILIF